MLNQNSIAAMTLAAALAMPITDAQAFDESKYADLSGQWAWTGVLKSDPTKPMGRVQLQFLITPNTTHVFFDDQPPRRIYTDGRDWPKDIESSLLGYSIGKWIDENGDGRHDVLEIETRGLKSRRSYEGSNIPFHKDNETVVKERIYLDKNNLDSLIHEITLFDHALTRAWTVTERFRRVKSPIRFQNNCSEDIWHLRIADR